MLCAKKECRSDLEGAGSNPGFKVFGNIFQTLSRINVLVANLTSVLPELPEICQRVGTPGLGVKLSTY